MPLLVLILGTFILEVKIEKIDCSQLGRNSSGVRQASGETALGYYPPWPLSQTVLAGQDQDENEDKDKDNSKGYKKGQSNGLYGYLPVSFFAPSVISNLSGGHLSLTQ